MPNLCKWQVSGFQSDVRTLPDEEKNFRQGEDQPRSPQGKNEGIAGEVNKSPWAEGEHPCGCNTRSDILSRNQLRDSHSNA